jgi:RNase P subunit RPR2
MAESFEAPATQDTRGAARAETQDLSLDAATRWRCGGCGNLTRFDVTRSTRRREYWHFDLAGEPRVEEAETLAEEVLEISCRWCGRHDTIERVARPDRRAESNDGAA